MSSEVNILLSTYNGEKYLHELLNSLDKQSYPFFKITIRDDGSSDNTINIIENYAKNRNNLKLIKGKNLGVIKSFFTLVQEADNSDYYAFCDQDDVWLPNKIERAINAISLYPKNRPVMYCSAYNLVDENLNSIGKTSNKAKRPSLENALVENIATGCTIVINKAAHNILINKLPQNALMHDWWMYLVVVVFGDVIYDPVPSILYRQHGSNAIGVKVNIIAKWMNRIKQYRSRRGERFISQQVSEFYELYKDELDIHNSELITRFLQNGFFYRIYNILNGTIYRHSIIDNFIFKILYLNKRL